MSRKVWYCPNCGYEVTSRGRCHSCGERLVASPLPELESGPEDDEVGYRLDQWDDETRGRLITALVSAGIRHRFEEEELVVLAHDEAEVDAIVAEVTGGPGPLESGQSDEPVAQVSTREARVARDLYDAANRLRNDPTDMQADVDVGEASAAVFMLDYLPGLDEDELAAVGRVTRRLLGALGADEALEDEIRHQAEVLCRLLAPSVGEVEAEAQRARARFEAAAKQKGRPLELPGPSAGSGGAQQARSRAEDGAEDLSELGEEGEDLDELDEEGNGEVIYELDEWLPEQRAELSMLVESAGIAHRWDGTDLAVAEGDEEEVDGLFEQVHGLVDDDDEVRYRMIEELFASVDRLANDPADPERQKAFLGSVGVVEQPTPVGLDDAYWWRVRSQGHAVKAAVEGGSRNDEISREAALLAEMLHEMV
ncbi:MAG: hypothetical protein ACP5VR_03895 [Acidimicrobiales bacterium]